MSTYFGYAHNPSSNMGNPSHQNSHGNGHHGGRSRRAPRVNGASNSHRQFRGVRSMKELAETPSNSAYRTRFECNRGFDLDDDLEFIPGLLTEDDVCSTSPEEGVEGCLLVDLFQSTNKFQLSSINSGSSDRSSLSSGSPSNSPLQHQVQPAQVSPPFSLANTYVSYQTHNHLAVHQNQMKMHQPTAVRQRNAIPIVNPTTGMRLPSPPVSVSPGRVNGQGFPRRW